MDLFRFFFPPVLLVVAVIAGRAEKARAIRPGAELRASTAVEAAQSAAPEPQARVG